MQKSEFPPLVKKVFRLLTISREDMLVYHVIPADHQPTFTAQQDFDLVIRQKSSLSTLFLATINGTIVSQCLLSRFNYLLWQLGYGKTRVIGHCKTEPEHRGLGIYPAVLSQIIQTLKNGGNSSQPVYIIVHPGNSPSIRGIEKAGFCFNFHLHATRLGPFMIQKQIEFTR